MSLALTSLIHLEHSLPDPGNLTNKLFIIKYYFFCFGFVVVVVFNGSIVKVVKDIKTVLIFGSSFCFLKLQDSKCFFILFLGGSLLMSQDQIKSD